MTAITRTGSRSEADFGLLPIFAAAAAGLTLIYFSGFAQASQYHDSAHDTRHTLAFPCH